MNTLSNNELSEYQKRAISLLSDAQCRDRAIAALVNALTFGQGILTQKDNKRIRAIYDRLMREHEVAEARVLNYLSRGIATHDNPEL